MRRVAHVKRGDKVVVIGDGAVGQCAVIAAKMRGASQIVLMSRHEDRQQMALEFGATAIVAERGEEGIAKVREILGGEQILLLNVSVPRQLSIKALGCFTMVVA